MKTFRDLYNACDRMPSAELAKHQHASLMVYDNRRQVNIVDDRTGNSVLNILFYPEENRCSLIKVNRHRCTADYDHPHDVKMDDDIKSSLTFHIFSLGEYGVNLAIELIDAINEWGY